MGIVETKYHASYVDFDTLLRTSDCIFVSVPLNKSTYHLIDGPEFAKMKDGVIIVNTSRGKVIREASLARALEIGKVAAAGLDVFEGVSTLSLSFFPTLSSSHSHLVL